MAVWIARVMGEIRMRWGTGEILICAEASRPEFVKGGSR